MVVIPRVVEVKVLELGFVNVAIVFDVMDVMEAFVEDVLVLVKDGAPELVVELLIQEAFLSLWWSRPWTWLKCLTQS